MSERKEPTDDVEEAEPVDSPDERELQAELEREMRFDGFEQGLQG